MRTRKVKQTVKDGIVFLKGKKVILRPIQESDIPFFLKWMNDPEIRQFITIIFPLTKGEEKEWLENLIKRKEKDIILAIVVKGKIIGSMGIHGINWKDRTATTGAIIGEKRNQGKGYGTDAKMVLLDYAFNTLNLRKMVSKAKAFNRRSIAYSLHCGYRIEGRLRKQHFFNGKYHDEVVLGIFKHEWLPYWEAYCKKK